MTNCFIKHNLWKATIALIVAFCCIIPVQAAYADVRRADIVYGESVESRDLSIADCPSIDAEYVMLMDGTGTVYFDRNALSSTQIASITKIMTAIVALECGVDLDTKITVSEYAASIGESTSSLQTGDVLDLETALTAMLVSSGNDAAQAIAENLGSMLANEGEDGYSAFIRAMNEKAAELGLYDSVFSNPHGLDFDEFSGSLHSTAHDVAVMGLHAMQNETFRAIVCQSEATITVRRGSSTANITLESTDKMLEEYDGACGIKTGFTQLAGSSFCGACERDGKMLIAAVINSSNDWQRFYDCEELFDWYFNHMVTYNLVNTSITTTATINGEEKEVPVLADVAHTGWIDKTIPVTILGDYPTVEVFDLNGNVSQDIQLDTITENIKAGDVVGTITFKQRNNTLGTYNLIACENCPAPNLFQGIKIWFQRLFKSFSGESTVATSAIYNTTPLLNDKSSIL